jgi:hypothetical protein
VVLRRLLLLKVGVQHARKRQGANAEIHPGYAGTTPTARFYFLNIYPFGEVWLYRMKGWTGSRGAILRPVSACGGRTMQRQHRTAVTAERAILAHPALTAKHGQQPLLLAADIKRFKLRDDMRFQSAAF